MAGYAYAISELEERANTVDKGECTILHTESESGNTERVRFILREFANKNLLEKVTIYKQTALHLAIDGGHTEVAEIIIDAARQHLPEASFQAFLRKTDKSMKTALHLAVMRGNVGIVKLLLKADPTDQNRNVGTLMYIAVEKGYTDIVKVMCTTCDPGGSTALHAAVKNRNHDIELVEVLIDAARRLLSSASDNESSDADNNRPVTSFQDFLRRVDQDGNTALHIAVTQGNLATAELLVKTDPSYKGIPNKNGRTAFYIAVEKRNFEMVKMMCETTTCTIPLFLDGPGGRSLTALHAVINNLGQENKVKEAIKLLTDSFKDKFFSNMPVSFSDEIFYRTDEHGKTILELAVEKCYVQVVEILFGVINWAFDAERITISLMPLIYKAKDKNYENMVEVLNERFEAGTKSLIHLKNEARLISAFGSDAETVSCLLKCNARSLVKFVDCLGWTALHYAVYHEYKPIIKFIIEAQEEFRYEPVYADRVSTPFHVAAERGYTSTMIFLMELWSCSSAYSNIDKNEQNILHLAALQGNKQMIQGILRYCPEKDKNELVNKQDKDGNTPLHLLIKCGCLVPEFLKYEGLDTNVKNKKKQTPGDMLYVQEQITKDQVKLKVALDYIQIDHKRDFFSNSELPASRQEKKDENYKAEAQKMTDGKLALIKDNTRAVAKCYADAIAGDPICRAALEIEADTLNQAGETILHVESKKGDIDNVRFIVTALENKNLLVKLDNQKQTALYVAAHHGHTQVVEALLDAAHRGQASASANDDIHNVPNSEGKTPIYIAAEKGYKDIVKEICTTCTALSLDGPDGRTTALHALIQNIGQVTGGASDMIRMIIHAAKRRSNAYSEEFFYRTDKSGSTVLQLAVEKNCVDAVRLILQEDPAFQQGREIKRNGLMLLVFKAIDNNCSDEIIKLLSQTYEAGIIPDHKDVIPLILAMKRRDEDFVYSLLEGAKDLVTFTEDNGWTPLHYAVYHEFDSVLGAIIGAQEDVEHQFVYGNTVPTPFHIAVKCGYTSTLVLLMKLWPATSSEFIAANSPYTAIDENGRNILHLAAAENRKEMVKGILKYCPKKYKDMILKQQDTSGDTPLHLLISHGCFILELIKDKGLAMAKNKKNMTPFEMLYLKNDVVGDQVHIKIAIDDAHTNQSTWNLYAKSTENKKDIFPNIPSSKRRMKDVIFDERKKLVMDAKNAEKKNELERYKTRTNTQIIVTALITTVTFTVGFTMPGGLRQSGEVDEGLAVLTKKAVFNAFMVSDALALLLSTCSLFIYFLGSMYEDPDQVSKLNALSVGLNIVSVMAMMLTFLTGTYLVLSHSPALAITVCLIGSFFFIFVIVLLIKFVYDRPVKRNED